LKTWPHFWIVPELVDRIIRGKSAILSDKELREANSSGGLNVATWQCGVSPEDVARGDVGNTIMAAFVKLISGFRIKEQVLQGESVEQMAAALAVGSFLWSATNGCYENFDAVPSEKLLKEHHVLGMSRDLALDFQVPGPHPHIYKPPHGLLSAGVSNDCCYAGWTEEPTRRLPANLVFR
jgi:hypothetical protein